MANNRPITIKLIENDIISENAKKDFIKEMAKIVAEIAKEKQ